MTPTERVVMLSRRSMCEYRRSALLAEREIAFFNGCARDFCPRCGGVHIGSAVSTATAYEGGAARPAERPSRL